MKPKTKIITLRTIKIGFDVAIVALSIFLLALITLVVFDLSSISTKSSLGPILAKAIPIEKSTTKDFVVSSKIKDITVTSYVNNYQLVLNTRSNDLKKIPIVYKIIFVSAINLSLFFLIFVLFQASKILKSIIKGMNEYKEDKEALQHYMFNKKNIHRFQYIAYGFIAMPIIELLLYCSDTYFLSTYFKAEGYVLKSILDFSSISWDYLFIGLLFISLIELIRRGIMIQEENDLTV